MSKFLINGIKVTKAQWEEIRTYGCTVKQPDISSKYDVKTPVSYKEVFTAHLPMYEQYSTETLVSCINCATLVDPLELGCVKCLHSETTQEVA